jgi:hypothetical protein
MSVGMLRVSLVSMLVLSSPRWKRKSNWHADELSVVCPEERVPEGVKVERGVAGASGRRAARAQEGIPGRALGQVNAPVDRTPHLASVVGHPDDGWTMSVV